tara:strand:+ start:177 stop:560 length:384 start_codon:yes stop_codon:yes gene_type:complete
MTKVIVSYGCNLADIPKTISELLGNLKENDIPLIDIDIQDAQLYSNEKNISEALDSIHEARVKLTKIDSRLRDYSNILAGYSKTNADIQMGIDPVLSQEGTQEVVPHNILDIREEENVNSKTEETND